jgi:hypothetical protein
MRSVDLAAEWGDVAVPLTSMSDYELITWNETLPKSSATMIRKLGRFGGSGMEPMIASMKGSDQCAARWALRGLKG